MLASQIPSKFSVPFANGAGGGYIRAVPTASQIGVTNGAASLTDGFPPLCFVPVGSGGYPPFGQDFNGLLNQITAWNRWQAAGVMNPWDSGFSTLVGGYPAGSIVLSTTAGKLWISTADNNTTNPDSGGVNWLPVFTSVSAPTRLTANTTFYVSPSGNDSAAGTAGAPWQTIQHAFNYIASNVILGGFIATIQLTAGTFTTGGSATSAWMGGGTSNVVVSGDASTPSLSIISTTSGSPLSAGSPGAGFTVQNVVLNTTAANACISANLGGSITIGGNVTFGAAASASHIFVAGNASVTVNSNYTITGGAQSHLQLIDGSVAIGAGLTFTITGTPNFSVAFAALGNVSSVYYNGVPTFSGSATGVRYLISLNSVLNTNGLASGSFPGNSTTAPTTGGQYA